MTKNMILYICDGKACDGPCDLCTHIANIEHAKNFKRVTAEQIFVERERRGRWIEARLASTSGGTYGVRRCSLCGVDYQDVGYGWNYCPNCGAKMDGGKDEESEE